MSILERWNTATDTLQLRSSYPQVVTRALRPLGPYNAYGVDPKISLLRKNYARLYNFHD